MKNTLILLIVFLSIVVTTSSLAQIAVPPLTDHINDYAGILSKQTREQLEKELQQHEDSTSNQIVILTIASLKGESIEEAANRIFNTWQLGQKEKNNGVLVLIAPDDRKMRIEVGYGLEVTLTDAHCNRIINNEMKPYFKYKKYDEGTIAGVVALRQALYGVYAAEDPGFFESLLAYEAADFPEVLLTGSFVLGILLLITLFIILIEGFLSWVLFLFLMCFYVKFTFPIFGSTGGFIILAMYIVTFIASKIWFCTPAGKAYLYKLESQSDTTTGSNTASKSSSRSSGRSSYSGGGGRSGGGGSSGSW